MEQLNMRCETKIFELGQYNCSRLISATGQYCLLQSLYLCKSHLVTRSSITYNSAWISETASNLNSFNWILTSWPIMTLYRKFLSFWANLACSCTQSASLVSVTRQTGYKFCSTLPIVKSYVKMCQNEPHDRPRMLQTSFIVYCLSLWITWRTF